MRRHTPLPSQDSAITQAIIRAEQTGIGYAQALLEMANRNSARYDQNGRRIKPTQRFGRRRYIGPTHENSLLALEMHRAGTMFGGPNAPKIRKCAKVSKRTGKRCGASAMKGSIHCRLHGGLRVRELQWRLRYSDYRYVRTRIATSILRTLQSLGRVPFDLLRRPDFAEILQRALWGITKRDPRFAHMNYAQRRHHHEACCDLALAFIAAYEAITMRGDWNPWVAATSEADKHGPWTPKVDAGKYIEF